MALNQPVKLNQRASKVTPANVERMTEVYSRAGSTSPQRHNKKKRLARHKFTVPQPFSMTERKRKTKTIMERRLEQDLIRK